MGPVLDGIHTHSGTLAYPHPVFFKMAWWVPPLFGSAALSLVSFVMFADRWLKRPVRRLSMFDVVLGFLVFVLVYFASGFWQAESIVKTILFTGVGVLFWWILDRTWQGAFEIVLIVFTGCVVESVLTQLGLFYYLAPDVFGIPYWLAPLYIVAAIAVSGLARARIQNI